jgi:P-type Ca2+ transporter type 2C
MEANIKRGLTSADAAQKLKQFGYNELPSAGPRSFLKIILETFKEPMLVLLLVCALIYFPLGSFEDAIILLVAALVIVIITVFQERKTENTLQALRELADPQAIVIRDGIEMLIPRREIVPEDLIIVREGGRVPADALVLDTAHLVVDESLLTGESVPVNKTTGNEKDIENRGQPGGDNYPYLYFGTLVVSGSGIARVFATGANTELGKIGTSLNEIERERTKLDSEVRSLVKLVSFFGLGACLLIVVIYGIFYAQWLKGLLSGLTLAMAMLPEEFPVVLTIFLSIGAWRIAKKNVLTRKISAIETLGATTVLCVDKTGTLTQNKMQIEALFIPADGLQKFVVRPPVLKGVAENNESLPESFHPLMEYAILASQKNPFDPMEKAILEFGESKLLGSEHIHKNWKLEKEYPLSPKMLSMSEVWINNHDDHYTVAAKGAPESIIDLCHTETHLATHLMEQAQALAAGGLRVLGVARATKKAGPLGSSQHDFDFEFIGFLGLGDPVRSTVPEAIAKCHKAGIVVKIITGDYAPTAINIAKQIGLPDPENVIKGDELSAMSDLEIAAGIKKWAVFSRVVPSQKLEIVNALKANNEIVAMTGDGVNDAPALKAAHIGIAMGQKGTDVAREAASIVLLNDDFSAIVDAISLGRRIFHNLQKAMSYIFAIHIPIAGLSLVPLFFKGMPVIFFPVHIVFLEMIIDPACTILFEAEQEENNNMDKPPRPLDMPILGNKKIWISLFQGLSVLAMVLAVYFITYRMKYTEQDVRTITFCAMVIANLSLILTNLSDGLIIFRKRRQNPVLLYMLGGNVALILSILYIPPVQKIFHFSTLHPDDLLISIIAGIAGILWFEMFKYISRRSPVVSRQK